MPHSHIQGRRKKACATELRSALRLINYPSGVLFDLAQTTGSLMRNFLHLDYQETRVSIRSKPGKAGEGNQHPYFVRGALAISSFENSLSSNLGLTTTLSIVIFSGGTGVSRMPSAFLPTGRTLVSKINGIRRPSTVR